jgi:hypothetical protein
MVHLLNEITKQQKGLGQYYIRVCGFAFFVWSVVNVTTVVDW